jgi:hypothetical protein
MSIVFLTYGDDKYKNSKKRIEQEAKSFNFDKTYIYGPDNLDKDFVNKNKHILQCSKGAGYWIWKPFICLKVLKTMKNNDILLYCDAGCSLNNKAMHRFKEYINLVKQSPTGILAFQMLHLKEKVWTKGIVFNILNAWNLADTGQVVGGIFFIKKCNTAIKLLQKWLKLVCIKQYVDDSPSIKNHVEFNSHRHDQSIFSILMKQNGSLMLKDETYPAYRKDFPIWASRIN